MHNYLKVLLPIIVISGCQSTQDKQTEVAVAPEFQILEMAHHYERAGEFEKSLLYYLKAVENSPTDNKLLYTVAELHKKMGKPHMALRMLKKVLAQNPEHTGALTEAALILLENKDMHTALSYLVKVTNIDQRRLSNQQKQTNELHALDKESPVDAYNGLAVTYDLLGQYTRAQNIYHLALNLNRHAPVVLTNLGFSYYLDGDYAKAIEHFHKAIDIAPGHKRGWYNLGLVYSKTGRYNKSFHTLRRVMSDEQAYNDLGYFLMLEQRYEEAEYFFEKAINTAPRYYEVAYNNLTNVREKMTVQNSPSMP